jgi:membrane-bound inhibitor of C-type lysozyme
MDAALAYAGKSYVWPEGGNDAWLENKRAAREEAVTCHEAMGRVPI